MCEVKAELPETRLIYVADREGDIYELFAEAEKCGPERAELLIRANQNRGLTDGQKLWEKAAAAPILGEITFTMPATKTRAAREVTQTLRATPVVLKAPSGKRKGAPAVHLTAVLAREEAPPKGVEAIQWRLLTTCAVDAFEQAGEILSWYLARWSIELFFKILKSGCKVEELQLEHFDRLEPALAMYMIIAWRVWLLTCLPTGRPRSDARAPICPATSCSKPRSGKRLTPWLRKPPLQKRHLPSTRWCASLQVSAVFSTANAMASRARKRFGLVCNGFKISLSHSPLSMPVRNEDMCNGMTRGGEDSEHLSKHLSSYPICNNGLLFGRHFFGL